MTPPTPGRIEVTIIGEEHHDLEELTESSRQLQDELLEIDGVRIEPLPDQPSREPTRSVAEVLAAFGVVAMYVVRPLLRDFGPHIARVIDGWVKRHKDKRVLVRLPDGSEYMVDGHDALNTRRLINKIEKTMRQHGADGKHDHEG